jgi:hypothetical protein
MNWPRKQESFVLLTLANTKILSKKDREPSLAVNFVSLVSFQLVSVLSAYTGGGRSQSATEAAVLTRHCVMRLGKRHVQGGMQGGTMRLQSAKTSEITGGDHNRKHRSSTTANAPALSPRAMIQHAS